MKEEIETLLMGDNIRNKKIIRYSNDSNSLSKHRNLGGSYLKYLSKKSRKKKKNKEKEKNKIFFILIIIKKMQAQMKNLVHLKTLIEMKKKIK